MESEKIKSYFFVFSEGSQSQPEENLIESFKKFEEIHGDESEVLFLTPKNELFDNMRTAFEVSKTPSFVLADKPYDPEKKNPYITFLREAIEHKCGPDRIYNLITDIHYFSRDENLLRMNAREASLMIQYYLRDVWDEIKDYVNYGIS